MAKKAPKPSSIVPPAPTQPTIYEFPSVDTFDSGVLYGGLSARDKALNNLPFQLQSKLAPVEPDYQYLPFGQNSSAAYDTKGLPFMRDENPSEMGSPDLTLPVAGTAALGATAPIATAVGTGLGSLIRQGFKTPVNEQTLFADALAPISGAGAVTHRVGLPFIQRALMSGGTSLATGQLGRTVTDQPTTPLDVGLDLGLGALGGLPYGPAPENVKRVGETFPNTPKHIRTVAAREGNNLPNSEYTPIRIDEEVGRHEQFLRDNPTLDIPAYLSEIEKHGDSVDINGAQIAAYIYLKDIGREEEAANLLSDKLFNWSTQTAQSLNLFKKLASFMDPTYVTQVARRNANKQADEIIREVTKPRTVTPKPVKELKEVLDSTQEIMEDLNNEPVEGMVEDIVEEVVLKAKVEKPPAPPKKQKKPKPVKETQEDLDAIFPEGEPEPLPDLKIEDPQPEKPRKPRLPGMLRPKKEGELKNDWRYRAEEYANRLVKKLTPEQKEVKYTINTIVSELARSLGEAVPATPTGKQSINVFEKMQWLADTAETSTDVYDYAKSVVQEQMKDLLAKGKITQETARRVQEMFETTSSVDVLTSGQLINKAVDATLESIGVRGVERRKQAFKQTMAKFGTEISQLQHAHAFLQRNIPDPLQREQAFATLQAKWSEARDAYIKNYFSNMESRAKKILKEIGVDSTHLRTWTNAEFDDYIKERVEKHLGDAGFDPTEIESYVEEAKLLMRSMRDKRKEAYLDNFLKDRAPSHKKAVDEHLRELVTAGELFPEKLKQVLSKKYGGVVITDATVSTIKTAIERLGATADPIDRSRILQQLSIAIKNPVPTALDKLKALIRISLFTAPRTTESNIIGTGLFQPVNQVSEFLAKPYDALIGAVTGNRTRVLDPVGLASGEYLPFKAMARGVKQKLKDVATGTNTFNGSVDKFDSFKAEARPPAFGLPLTPGKSLGDTILGGLDAYTTLSLGLPDAAITTANKEAMVKNLMAAGVDVNAPGVMDVIDSLAAETSFTNQTPLGKTLQNLKKSAGLFGPIGENIAEMVQPVVGTPASIAHKLVDYSPLGFLRSKLTGEAKDPIKQYELSKRLAEATVGSGAYAGLYNAMQDNEQFGLNEDGSGFEDYITTNPSLGPDAKRQYVEALRNAGLDPAGINLDLPGGPYNISTRPFSPVAIPFNAVRSFVATERENDLQEEENSLQPFSEAVNTGLQDVPGLNLLESYSRGAMGDSGPMGGVANVLGDIPGVFLPQALQRVSNAWSPYKQDPTENPDTPGLESFMAKLGNATGIRTTGTKYDIFGNPLEKQPGLSKLDGVTRAVKALVDPFNTSKADLQKPSTKLLTQYMNLYKETGDLSMMPSDLPTKFTLHGKSIRPTTRQRNEFRKINGRLQVEVMPEIMRVTDTLNDNLGGILTPSDKVQIYSRIKTHLEKDVKSLYFQNETLTRKEVDYLLKNTYVRKNGTSYSVGEDMMIKLLLLEGKKQLRGRLKEMETGEKNAFVQEHGDLIKELLEEEGLR